MTDRDRLIELIKEAKKNTKGANCDLEREMLFADYLLENGVIVPPCKIGDTIYHAIFHKSGTGACVEYQVVGFHLGEFPKLRGQKRKQYFIVWHEVTNSISHLDFEQIGKTVFLTREEAEQALKEREKNG